MNNILLNSFVALIILLSFSCKKQDIMNYEGKDAVYFTKTDNSNNFVDSINLSFGYAGPNVIDSIIAIPVTVLGYLSSYDRKVSLSISDLSTAKVDIDYSALPDFYIAANHIRDTLKIKFHRTKEMLNNTYNLIVNILPNENFDTSLSKKAINSTTFYNSISIKISVNDILQKPKYWLDSYLGIFSRKKIYLMADILQISIQDIANNSSIPTEQFWGRYMQLYLNDQRSNGKAIYEEDGVTLMVMGNSVQ